MSVHNPSVLRYTPVPPVQFTVNAGVAQWVDTDVSAVAGNPAKTERYWLVQILVEGFATVPSGIREHGGAVDNSFAAGVQTQVTKTSATGRCDCFRQAGGAINYIFEGYFSAD